jgi:hypothetical protein
MEMVVGFVVLCWTFGYLSAYLVKLFVSVCGYLGFTAPRPTYFTFPPVSGAWDTAQVHRFTVHRFSTTVLKSVLGYREKDRDWDSDWIRSDSITSK